MIRNFAQDAFPGFETSRRLLPFGCKVPVLFSYSVRVRAWLVCVAQRVFCVSFGQLQWNKPCVSRFAKTVCTGRCAQWQEETNSDCKEHVMSFFAKTPTKIAAGPFQEPLPKHTSSGKVDQCAIECGCLNLGLRNAGFCNLKLACSGLPQSRAWEAFVVAKPKFQFAQCIYNPL